MHIKLLKEHKIYQNIKILSKKNMKRVELGIDIGSSRTRVNSQVLKMLQPKRSTQFVARLRIMNVHERKKEIFRITPSHAYFLRFPTYFLHRLAFPVSFGQDVLAPCCVGPFPSVSFLGSMGEISASFLGSMGEILWALRVAHSPLPIPWRPLAGIR